MNERFYSNDLQCVVHTLTKGNARKWFYKGKTIYFHPCNMDFDNAWQKPEPINMRQLGYKQTFDTLIAIYKYYNCDCERGDYVKFYIKVTDLKN